MGDYQPLNLHNVLFQPPNFKSKERKCKYKIHSEGKEVSKINAVEFNTVSPSKCTIASGTQVSIYDFDQQKVTGNFTAAKNIVNCASFRNDGRLIAIGDDSAYIHIVNTENRMRLRRFKKHSSAVRCCRFLNDKTTVISGSDDTTLKLWDIPQETCKQTLAAHSDSVRSIIVSPTMGGLNLCASGSYDGTVKLWDTRNGTMKESLTITHGLPVEDVAFYSNGIHLASAGGNTVKVWDLSSGGKLMKSFVNHMKTVTSIAITTDDSLLLTGSLDKTAKWTCNYTAAVLKSYFLNSEVLSVSLSATNDAFAVGMANGNWMVRSSKANASAYKNLVDETPKGASFKGIIQSSARYYSSGHIESFQVDDKVVDGLGRKTLSPVDKLLRNFQYKDALDVSLTLSSTHVVNLLEELIRRGALYIALGGRDEVSILPTLQFMYRNIGGDLRYTSIILEALQILLDENEWIHCATDGRVLEMLKRISQKLGFELTQQSTLQEVQGVLDMILTM